MNNPLKRDKAERDDSPDISCNSPGCITKAKIPASRADTNKVINDGTFLAINMAVTNGTTNNHNEISNVCPKAAENSATCSEAPASCVKPAIVKINKVKAIEGTVVSII